MILVALMNYIKKRKIIVEDNAIVEDENEKNQDINENQDKNLNQNINPKSTKMKEKKLSKYQTERFAVECNSYIEHQEEQEQYKEYFDNIE